MLRQVLKAFSGQSAMSTSALAERAGVQETLLLQMLGDLVRLGYLEENADCSTSCAACAHEVACKPSAGQAQRLWTLSEKGRKLLLAV